MGNIEKNNIKNHTHYFSNNMINIKNSDSSLLEIDKKLCKKTDIHYIGYITIKDTYYVNINSVNPLYLIINEADWYTGEKMEINT